MSQDRGVMRCSGCRAQLVPSGQEPTRFICEACGQNFQAVMHLVPVEPLNRRPPPLLPDPTLNAERRS